MKYAFVKSFTAKCHRLAFNLSKSQTPPSYSEQALFAAGNDVDAIALETILKPYHTMVATSTLHGDWLATRKAIANGITKINQATFKAGEAYIRVDSIDLERMKLTEVKAGSSVKDDYIIDLALQEFFLRQAGMRHDEFSLILREKSFVTGSPWNEALKEINVTSEVKSLLEQDHFIEFVEVYDAGYDIAPEPVFGKSCKTCDFKGQCWSELEHPSFMIPRFSEKLLEYIIANEAFELANVPRDILTKSQLEYKESALNSEISISKVGLTSDLAQFTSPIAHLDFEAFNMPYHTSKNTKTFEMVPFQASIHLEDVDGSVSHYEHLCRHEYDDRESLAAFLVENLSSANAIVVWNVSFERRMLQHLARVIPKYSEDLSRLIGKLVDLHPVVKANVKHHGFSGSYSLKAVAPVLCPVTYKGLDIDNGNDANGVFQLLTRGQIPPSEIPNVREDLLHYCRNDTVATLAILNELRKYCKGEEKNEDHNYAKA